MFFPLLLVSTISLRTPYRSGKLLGTKYNPEMLGKAMGLLILGKLDVAAVRQALGAFAALQELCHDSPAN
jgi:hypothetical protein